MPANVLAAGARVEIRSAEWIVRRVDATSTGGYSLLVTGVSEIVRDKEARFLTEIEGKGIKVLDPAETELVTDPSPQFRNTKLYLESLLRQSPPTDTDLWIGPRAAIDDLPFQLDPALQALDQPRQRILMADSTGLGKTIEVGVLLSELIKRGRGKRILVVTVKSMMTQFQKEMWSRFTIPLVRLDSVGIDRIRTRIPANANPFHYYDRAIISIDTLKASTDYRVHLERCRWDVIVIDEAQNVAVRGSGRSLRAKLAELLSRQSDTLIMTSATPHDGKPASFASLMNMLNPTAIANPENYGPEDIKGLFVRRFKKDVQDQIAGAMKDRRVMKRSEDASPKEERAYEILASLKFRSLDRAQRAGQLLFRTVLEKALFSSPAACLQTINARLKKLEVDASPEAAHDRTTLQELATALDAITPADFSKYRKLLEDLRPGGKLEWDPENPADRLVIFSERIETVKFLKENLARDLKLKAGQVEVLYGGSGQDDIDLQQIVGDFGRDRAPVRLLIASDIASEGINLHFLSHKLLHFDIPWSLMVFQQRNGRVDRYGQERQPVIAYFYTTPRSERVRGDLRILELLIEKDTQAAKNIGDPSAFLGVYDEQEEELIIGHAIEECTAPADFERKLEQNAGDDLLAALFGDEAVPKGSAAHGRTRTPISLYPSDLEYVRSGLVSLRPKLDVQAEADPSRQMISLTINEDLRRVFRFLPREVVPEDGRLHLTADRALVKKAIKDNRADDRAHEQAWPDIHLLWDLHPIVEWLNFKLMVSFRRHEAPVVTLPALERGELLYLIEGEIPNRKAQPVVHEWCAVRFLGGALAGTIGLDDFLRRTEFGARAWPNPGHEPNLIPLRSLLPEAIAAARRWISKCRAEYEQRMQPRLAAELEKLQRLHGRQHEQLELDFRDEGAGFRETRLRKKDEKARHIDRTFHEWETWVRDSMTTEDQPYLRLAAVFRGAER
jgi:superfamily II DNA/RNA helicase